jgi:LysM repeat protein
VNEIAPGEEITCTAVYTITQADIESGSVTNRAGASIYAFGYNLMNSRIAAFRGEQTANTIINYALPPTLEKTADLKSYDAVDQVITYTYTVKNVNDVPIPGPVTVDDDKVAVTCQVEKNTNPITPTFTPTATSTSAISNPTITARGTLSAPSPTVTAASSIDNLKEGLNSNETIFCTGTYTISQNDLDFGSVSNTAIAHVGEIDSNQATFTVPADQKPGLTLTKSAAPSTFNSVGQSITYTYVIVNSGNITLGPGQFRISDKLIKGESQFICGPESARLAPKETLTCNQVYTVSAADLAARSVINTATASWGEVTSLPATAQIICPYPPAGWVVYVVQNDDTLYSISGWYNDLGMTVERLMQENCLSSTTIRVGQDLYVPRPPPPPPPGSISGIVAYDVNRNTVYDSEDPGAPDFRLVLIDTSTNAPVATAITDEVGHYEFPNLPPGTYRISPFYPEITVSPDQDLTGRNFIIFPTY